MSIFNFKKRTTCNLVGALDLFVKSLENERGEVRTRLNISRAETEMLKECLVRLENMVGL